MTNRNENRNQPPNSQSTPLSVGDYSRLKKGYERGISPDALERMAREEAASAPEGTADRPSEPTRVIRPVAYVPRDFEKVAAERRRQSRRIGPIGIFLIGTVGIVGGLFLYAGGVDIIESWFASAPEEVLENPTLVTERPDTAGDNIAAVDPAAVVEDEGEGDEEILDEPAEPVVDEEPDVPIENVLPEAERRAEAVATTRTEQSREQEGPGTAPAAAREERSGGPDVTDLTPTTSSRSTTSSSRYSAQIGATPDRAEADRIAATLRSRGGSNVVVQKAERNGETIYRVRFGSFGSEDEAKRKAIDLGYRDIWVTKQ